MVKIFLVSDNQNIIERYSRICEQNSFNVGFSSDMAIIEEMIGAENFDLIIVDNGIKTLAPKNLITKIKSVSENTVIILLANNGEIDKSILKSTSAIITEDFDDNLISAAFNINLRMKNALTKLSDTNNKLSSPSPYICSR